MINWEKEIIKKLSKVCQKLKISSEAFYTTKCWVKEIPDKADRWTQ